MAKKSRVTNFGKEKIKKSVIADMEHMGFYKSEYEKVVDIYADLLMQYQEASERFEQSGRQYETETANGGTKKSAIVTTLEALRKDILAYSDRLCLNPKTAESLVVEDKKPSKLEEALLRFGNSKV